MSNNNNLGTVEVITPGDAEIIARVCHEANKGLCEAFGDTTQVGWNDAPQWQKDSAIMGVVFTVTNQHAPASANHDSWLVQKEKEGWVYGEVKDAEKKTHPCMVPYAELPLNQQLKDSLFRGVVMSFAGKIFPFASNNDKPNPEQNPEPVRESVKVEASDTKIIKLTADLSTLIKGSITEDGLLVGHWEWAWSMLNKGYALRLPSWKGYWKWDSVEQMIILFTKKGEQLRFNMLEDWFYTLNGIADVRWEIAEDAGTVELTVATMPFSDALRFLRKDKLMVCDESNHLGVFICKENEVSVNTNLVSIDGGIVQNIIGKTGKLHFGEKLLCVTKNGIIQGWNPGDDELLSKTWRESYITYEELLQYNQLTGINAGGGQ